MKCLIILTLSLRLGISTNEIALQEFTKANNLFAVDVYKELTKVNDGNFLVSPYSVETILALTQSGCRGDTAQEIRKTLHLSDDNNKIEAGVNASIPLLTRNNLYTLHTANKIYIKKDFPIKKDFIKSAIESYGADIEPIDFLKNFEAANTMNKWVEEKTNHKIQDLISPYILDSYTRLILINALYFKANWSKQFFELTTTKENFYNTIEHVVQVDMMHQYRKWYRYSESSYLKAQILELPFQGDDDVSMVIVLPFEKDGLRALEQQIDKVFAPHDLETEHVNVALPKFRVESMIQFKPILKRLGVKKAFSGQFADLSGISGKPGDLEISDVVQKTYVDVREGGVEAAAAAYVPIAIPISAEIDETKNFVADHPFIFFIKAKHFIIFAGRVVTPNH